MAPLLPTGAVLVIKQWYDNSADNPNNPDPDQWVYGGSRTGDEMSHAWIAITHLDDEGYEKIVADRRPRSSVPWPGSTEQGMGNFFRQERKAGRSNRPAFSLRR